MASDVGVSGNGYDGDVTYQENYICQNGDQSYNSTNNNYMCLTFSGLTSVIGSNSDGRFAVGVLHNDDAMWESYFGQHEIQRSTPSPTYSGSPDMADNDTQPFGENDGMMAGILLDTSTCTLLWQDASTEQAEEITSALEPWPSCRRVTLVSGQTVALAPPGSPVGETGNGYSDRVTYQENHICRNSGQSSDSANNNYMCLLFPGLATLVGTNSDNRYWVGVLHTDDAMWESDFGGHEIQGTNPSPTYSGSPDMADDDSQPFGEGDGMMAGILLDTTSCQLLWQAGSLAQIREIIAASACTSATPLTASLADGGPSYPGEIGPGGNPSEPSTTCSCGDPINTATGAYTESGSDLAVTGRGPGLDAVRSYNSANATANGPFGPGWWLNYSMQIRPDPAYPGYSVSDAPVVDVVQENGSVVPFSLQANGSYLPPERGQATLAQNSDGTWTFVRRHQLTFTFNDSGALTQVSDLNGYLTMLGYNGTGVLTTVTDNAGRTLTFAYQSGLISSITGPAGRVVQYGYTSGQLTSVTDPDGNITTYGYDGNGRLTTVEDPRGNTTANTYGTDGRVTAQQDRRGHTTTLAYSNPADDASDTVTVTDPRGNVTTLTYSNDELTSETNGDDTPAAATTTYTYDSHTDTLLTVEDPRSNTTTNTYNSDGDLLTRTDPRGNEYVWTYNSKDQPLTYTDPSSVTTTYGYDNNGNLTSVSTPLGGSGDDQVTRYHYEDSDHPGDVTSTTDPDGKTTTYGYDSYGQRTSVTDPNGDETTYSYTCSSCDTAFDNIGWVYATVSPRGNVTGGTPSDYRTSYSYNADGDELSVTDPLGHETDYDYDDDGNLTSVTDARDHTTGYAYNANNQPTTTTLPDTTTTSTGYDDDGNVTSQTDGNGHSTTYNYDPLNRVSQVTSPATATDSGGIVTGYSYDGDGNLTGLTQTGSGGSTLTTSYGYDHADRLTSIDYSDPNTPDVSYGYDNDGRRTSMSDGTGDTSYSYDSLGRLTDTADGANQHVSYGYDLNGNVTSITYPSGHTVTRSFDDSSRLTQVSDWNDQHTDFSYNPDSELTDITYPNGVDEATSYDHAGNPGELTDTNGAATLADYNYTRNPDNQLTAAAANGSNAGPSENYDLNSRGQLDSYDNGTTSGAFSYDAAGNLTAQPDGTTASFDNADELTSTANAGSSVTTAYSYDPRGDRTQANPDAGTTQNYNYDQANRLTGYTAGSNTASYNYNGDGLRTAKTVNSTATAYTWDPVTGANPLLLTDSSTSYLYGPGDLPIEQVASGGTTTYLQHDQQNSTRLITDASGAVTGTYNYTPYGATINHNGSGATALRYNGQYQDDETSYYYLRARYYDPATAQFLTRDPLEDETGQPYSYAGDDPLDNSDPSGEFCIGSVCTGFHPMAGVDALVNIGRGATGGLTNDVANWISPGASCTVAGNRLDEGLGFAGSLLVGGEGLTSLADRLGSGNWAFENRFIGVGSRLFGNESEFGGVAGRAGLLNPAGKGAWRIGWSVNGRTGTGLRVLAFRLKTPITDAYSWLFMGPTL